MLALSMLPEWRALAQPALAPQPVLPVLQARRELAVAVAARPLRVVAPPVV